LPALDAAPGIGSARAAAVIAALELGRRLAAAPPAPGRRFLCSEDVFAVYHARLRHCPHESFLALALDRRSRCRRELTLARGSGGAVAVQTRDVFRELLAEGAAAVIFLHNHPSGDPSPSLEDRALTARLCAAGELLGLRVLDHVIIGDGRYASMADRGELGGLGREGRAAGGGARRAARVG
jgi:DNA repair protein RadC